MVSVVSIEMSNANARGALIDIHELEETLNFAQFLDPNYYYGRPNRLDSANPTKFINTVVEMANQVAGDSKDKVKCVGVALSGAIGEGDDIWVFPGNGRPITWNIYDVLRSRLEREFGRPIRLMLANRAHMAAWGEYRYRQNKDMATRHTYPNLSTRHTYPNMIYLTIGGSIGAGIVSNSHLHVGSNGSAGLIGHVPIDPTSTLEICPGCGTRGCLSAVASGRAIVREYLALGHRTLSGRVQADSAVSDDDRGKIDVGYREQWDLLRPNDQDQGGYVDALSIVKAAEPDDDGIDEIAVKAVRAIANPLTSAIVQMSMFYDPGITILGGVGCLSNVLRSEIEDLAKGRLPAYLLSLFRVAVPHLCHPTYGDVAALFGMAWYVADQYQEDSLKNLASSSGHTQGVAVTKPLPQDTAVRPTMERETRT